MTFTQFDKATLSSILEGLFGNSFDPIVLTSAKSGYPIVYVNQPFCEMTGYSLEELLGKSPKILQGEKSNPNVLARLQECITQDIPFQGATTNYKKDGTPYPVEWNISAIKDEDNNIIYYLSIQKDLTKLKKYFLR